MANIKYINVSGKTGCVEYISTKYGLEKKLIKQILESETEYIMKCLYAGLEYKLNGLGTFKYTTIPAKEERVKFNYLTQKEMTLPACDTYSRLKFKPSVAVQREIKSRSLGQPFGNFSLEVYNELEDEYGEEEIDNG